MDAIVEFLFKYRPIVWEGGHVALGSSWPTRIAVLIFGALALAAVVTYVQVRVRGTQVDRRKLIALRAALLILLIFVLLQPVLVVSSAVGRRNVVGVLVDDSRSMLLKDIEGGRSRADVVRSLLGGPDSTLFKALNERFTVRFFRVGGNGSRVENFKEIAFDAPNTRLASALEGARQELAGTPLSGLVLVSDGADNAPGKLTETLLSLNARKVPVFTLGVGQARFAKDIEVSRVEAPHSVLKGASVILNVDVAQRGFGGTAVKVVAEDSGRIVGMETVTLPRDGEATTVRVRVPANNVGPRVFTVRIAPQADEMVTENNAQPAMVMVRDRREKILYVTDIDENVGFLREQALGDDDNLQLVTLARTAKDRFLRLGVDDSLELVGGFPTKREELFAYRGIILGNIEASAFTVEQLRWISDFVSERGGGFLMLGGRKSFAEGGYGRTPIADVLPVELPKSAEPVFRQVKVDLTPTGALYAVTQIAPSESASVLQWKKMPEVSSVNRILGAKPGAGELLIGAPKGGAKKEVVLAYQRYGHGTAYAFPIQDSWVWQMQPAVEDKTYESFWRQILRALVNDVPGRVRITINADQVAPKESFQVSADVLDKSYNKVNGAKVTATMLAPSGSVTEVPLEWNGIRDGEYYASFTPKEEGVHTVRVTAQVTGDTTAMLSDPAFVEVGAPATEYFGAEQRTALLRRVAEETGGQYYTPANAAAIAKDLVYARSGNNGQERLDLWDMPILFVLLVALAAAEWMYRRGRGLI